MIKILLVFLLLAIYGQGFPIELIETVVTGNEWPVDSYNHSLGAHRAKIFVKESQSDAIYTKIIWRRRYSPSASAIDVAITSANAINQTITNKILANITQDIGEIVFQPIPGINTYFAYFLPYGWKGGQTGNGFQVTYDLPKNEASEEWVIKNHLTPPFIANGTYRTLPKGIVEEIQSKNDFETFHPMEITPTDEEFQKYIQDAGNPPFLFIQEDRKHQIRMQETIPFHWLQKIPSNILKGVAERGEFFVFQLGIFANQFPFILNGTNGIIFQDLQDGHGNSISASQFRCFNVEGIDYLGNYFTQSASISQGKVGALWIGLNLTDEVKPGMYEGKLTLLPLYSNEPIEFLIELNVTEKLAINHGYEDLTRMARLAWLDSTLGMERTVTNGFEPLNLTSIDQNTYLVTISNRQFIIGEDLGIIGNISVGGSEILVSPIDFIVSDMNFQFQKMKILEQDQVSVTYQILSTSTDQSLSRSAIMTIYFDGYVEGEVSFIANKDIQVENITLDLQISQNISTYAMGLLHEGGNFNESFYWNWNSPESINSSSNMVWVGDINAGIRIKLKGEGNDWDSPLWVYGKEDIPVSWGGSNLDGGFSVLRDESPQFVHVLCYSSSQKIEKNIPLTFRFDLVTTPVKQLDFRTHFKQRYYQYGYTGLDPPQTIAEMGVTIVNLHQGTSYNPYINYPFLPETIDSITNFTEECKSYGIEKVKIYNTVRELSNRAYEIWALRMLPDQIFTAGDGGGASWLQEHLVADYDIAWSTGLDNGEVDAAIHDSGISRFTNFYIEGLLELLVNQPKLDGLYLDEVAFSRNTFLRMRRTMDNEKSGNLFDLHSCNKFDCPVDSQGTVLHASSALVYMAHLGSIDSLWFGEDFYYEFATPDYWLVEISGIAFGLMSDLIQSRWLYKGMLFGSGYRPSPDLWKVWDLFGISDDDVDMFGFWQPDIPVTTSDDRVYTTVYRKPGKSLLVVAGWQTTNETLQVTLNYDWNALGIDESSAVLSAPSIPSFQNETMYEPNDLIPIGYQLGWIFILEEKSK